MKIQVNKHYINAVGDIIFIRKYEPDITYCFTDNGNCSYTLSGHYLSSKNENNCDLICECNTDILNKYMDKDITQKEFIQQHIEYWS